MSVLVITFSSSWVPKVYFVKGLPFNKSVILARKLRYLKGLRTIFTDIVVAREQVTDDSAHKGP